MKRFSVRFAGQPWRNRSFEVRGICEYDVLNPCWDHRYSDIPGLHWGGGPACDHCTAAAAAAVHPEKDRMKASQS